MRTLSRSLAVAVVSVLALTGCIRVEMNVTLNEDDTASGDFVFAVSQELLAIAGEEGLEEMLNEDETIPGGTTERYESEDTDANGDPAFVGSKTTFSDLPLAEFDAAGEGLSIARDGDDFVVSGTADDINQQTGGEELPGDATATLSVTFPGAVSDHNGELDGNTVTWNLLEHTGELEARGSASPDGGGFPLWIILALAAVVGIGAGIAGVLIVSGRRKSADDSQEFVGEPAQGWDTTPAGDPIDAPAFTTPVPAETAATTDTVEPADASALPDATADTEPAVPETTTPEATPTDGPDEETPRP